MFRFGEGRSPGPRAPSPRLSSPSSSFHTFTIVEWAADLDSGAGSGIDTIHAWAYPVDGGDPIFLGAATLGGQRQDVRAIYGERFTKSGHGLTVQDLTRGSYDLAVFAWSTV